ncbi:hypothetical protein [Stutzerimonas tarimensis]|uniref:Transmembrane protein n=1 Tax=Stutzerimonas tarimensis TaxID=1507735 RepID=A0ABV7T153_9GAMM
METPDTQRRRGRLQLLLILGLVIAPMVLASAMYHLRFWVPEGRSYHGELLADGRTLADLGITTDARHWQLLVTETGPCAEDCQTLVYLARQINIGLGREADRAGHALALTLPLAPEYAERLQREYPRLQHYPLDLQRYSGNASPGGAQLWVIDPHGNLVLRYDAKARGKAILGDLKQLLKLSRIG